MRSVSKGFIAPMIGLGAMLAIVDHARAGEPFSIPFPAAGSPEGNVFELEFGGPGAGVVTDARVDFTFTTLDEYDAYDLAVTLTAPISASSQPAPATFVTGGLQLNWFGPGAFTASFAIPELLGEISPEGASSTWLLAITGNFLSFPPLFFGSFSEGSGFFFQIEPVPGPGGASALLLVTGAMGIRRHRRM